MSATLEPALRSDDWAEDTDVTWRDYHVGVIATDTLLALLAARLRSKRRMLKTCLMAHNRLVEPSLIAQVCIKA